jgi:heme/copper-type cytochrome/quinol oxidase subunit 3
VALHLVLCSHAHTHAHARTRAHAQVVKRNLISGVWLFIASEAALFFGLLWSCIHLGMQPNVNIQMQWPPVGIEVSR